MRGQLWAVRHAGGQDSVGVLLKHPLQVLWCRDVVDVTEVPNQLA